MQQNDKKATLKLVSLYSIQHRRQTIENNFMISRRIQIIRNLVLLKGYLIIVRNSLNRISIILIVCITMFLFCYVRIRARIGIKAIYLENLSRLKVKARMRDKMRSSWCMKILFLSNLLIRLIEICYNMLNLRNMPALVRILPSYRPKIKYFSL
jgi:hypothetical protein